MIDPAKDRLVADLPVGDHPTRVVAGDGYVWALNEGARTVSQINPSDRSVRSFAIGRTPDDIAVGGSKLWVGEPATGTLDEVDPTSGATLRHMRPRLRSRLIPYNNPNARFLDAGNVAFDAGEVWFGSGNGTLARIDAKTLRVKSVISGLEMANDGQIVPLPQAVWVADDYGTFTHIDRQSNEVLGRAKITQHDTGGIVVTPDGTLWATDLTQNSLWEIDGTNNSPVTSFTVGSNPVGIAFGLGSLWIANSGDGTVTRLDPGSGRTKTIHVGGSPLRVAFANGLVWVTID